MPENASVWFAGDCHGVFSHIISAARRCPPKAIIFLGDLCCPTTLDSELRDLDADIEVAYIPGNHDSDSVTNWDNLTQSQYLNLHTNVPVVAGLRIAGLGGVFRKPWYPRSGSMVNPQLSGDDYAKTVGKGNLFRGGLPLRHRTTIFPADVSALSQQIADVLVTHEAPGMHPLGFDVVADLAARMGVKHAFHGHLHESVVYPESSWTGVGFRSVVDLSGEIIVKASEDDTH